MQTLTIRVPDELEDRLERLCRETKRTKTHYVRAALEEFLEAREDYLLAVAVLERREPTITLDELERELDLAN